MDDNKWTQLLAVERMMTDAGILHAATYDTEKHEHVKLEGRAEPEKWFAFFNGNPNVVLVNKERLSHLEEIERQWSFANHHTTLTDDISQSEREKLAEGGWIRCDSLIGDERWMKPGDDNTRIYGDKSCIGNLSTIAEAILLMGGANGGRQD